jgi:hypothetical protein
MGRERVLGNWDSFILPANDEERLKADPPSLRFGATRG